MHLLLNTSTITPYASSSQLENSSSLLPHHLVPTICLSYSLFSKLSPSSRTHRSLKNNSNGITPTIEISVRGDQCAQEEALLP